jgi:wyosine [tRNA(Phe)-imidazoG37] synthetase (radical SAM superfamily)
MSIGTINKIADECALYNMPAVNIGGCSEPLLDARLALETIGIFCDAGCMDIFFHTNAVLLSESVSEKLIASGLTFFCVSIDAATGDMFSKVRGGDFGRVVKNVEKFLEIRGSEKLPALRVSFLETRVNTEEKNDFIGYWKAKADFVEVQKYNKSYDTQPAAVSDAVNTKAPLIYSKKRFAVVPAEYLCQSCSGIDVSRAVSLNNTLSKFGSLKSYWDNFINRTVDKYSKEHRKWT